MTTTALTDSATGLTRAERVTLGVLAPLAPLSILVLILAIPGAVTEDPTESATFVAANLSSTLAGLWLGLLAGILFIIAPLVVGSVARRSSRVVGTVGAVLTFLGFALSLALGPVPEGLYMAAAAKGIDPATAGGLYTAMLDIAPISLVDGSGWLIGALGVVVMGIALARSKEVPMWAAAILIISMPLIIAGWMLGIMPAAVLGYILLIVGFAMAGLAFTRPAAA